MPTRTSLLWLVRHLTTAEALWLLHRFAEQPVDVVPSDRLTDDDTVEAAVEAYRSMWAQVDEIATTASLDDLCRSATVTPPTNLRWVLAHLLEETARHAFEPFYTTRNVETDVGVSIGLGLGLSICRQIVKNHYGEISVRTERGKGTEFTLLLPVNPPAPKPAVPAA